MGQTRLGAFFVICVLQLYSLVDRFRLGGSQRGFLLSSLVPFLVTHLCVILCLHLSSLTLVLYFYCLLFMFMHQSSYRFIALHLLLFRTQKSQSKSNLVVIFILGSKQALVYSHKSELSNGIRANVKGSSHGSVIVRERMLGGPQFDSLQPL